MVRLHVVARNCMNPKCLNITINPKFCSRSCAVTVNNVTAPKRSVEGLCECGVPIPSARTFCKTCLPKRRRKDPKPPYHYKKDFVRKRKLKALAYLGGVCVECGTTQNLQFDHISPKFHGTRYQGARGRMDEAPVCGTGRCRFESCRARWMRPKFDSW